MGQGRARESSPSHDSPRVTTGRETVFHVILPSVLTAACYKLLARARMPNPYRRAFMAILCEYDLRTFVFVDPVDIFYRYAFDRYEDVELAIVYFENAGLLEPGPRVNQHQTYRIRQSFLMSENEITKLQAEREARAEREKIIPQFGVPPH